MNFRSGWSAALSVVVLLASFIFFLWCVNHRNQEIEQRLDRLENATGIAK